MGADIHIYSERKNEQGAWECVQDDIGYWREYKVFGFLADVRNYSGIQPISQPRGLPSDVSQFTKAFIDNSEDMHSLSYLTTAELLEYDYDQIVEDRRCEGINEFGFYDGSMTCEPGFGEKMPLKEFLGTEFFDMLNQLQAAKIERIVFCFDN